MTSGEVDAYLGHSQGVILPVGSIEQHGNMGLLGTDALCAEHISRLAARDAGAIVAPALSYTPAQFNMSFAGTVSVPAKVFSSYFESILIAFGEQGFSRIYVLNAHGANLAPMEVAMHDVYGQKKDDAPLIRIRSWWEFDEVNALRDKYYGKREGLHGTPSEIAITQYTDRVIQCDSPPAYRELSKEYIRDHGGDKHLPASMHRLQFPDGQVGSDPTLATAEQGKQLLQTAASAVARDYREFVTF